MRVIKRLVAFFIIASTVGLNPARVGSRPIDGSLTPSLFVKNENGDLIRAIDADGRTIELLNPDGNPVVQDEVSGGKVMEPAWEEPPRTVTDTQIVGAYGLDYSRPGALTHSAAPLVDGKPTIDLMTTTSLYSASYAPAETFQLVGKADTYYLSDGSSWRSGAGSYSQSSAYLDRVEISGDTVKYVFLPPSSGHLYRQTDFDSGDHSAQGTLGVAGPLELEATIGSTTAVMRGHAEILSNEQTSYGDRFNFYSCIVGCIVPFEVTYTHTTGTWTSDTFNYPFSYRYAGSVDFNSPNYTPEVISLEIRGSAQVGDDSSVPYSALAHYDNAASKEVTGEAVWMVDPADLASIDEGFLTTQPLTTPEETLTLIAEYTENDITVMTEKQVLCRAGAAVDLPLEWEMYQADTRHTGYLPIPLEPDIFSLRWQKQVGPGKPLNPVTAADGKVYVSLRVRFDPIPSLFALDARDGEILWSKEFGSVNSVNPPSFAYGNVYVQTGNHGDDTYLWAFDAGTGQTVFQSPHSAQWERYYAPTVFDGTVYIDGGYYGGMYAFDAFAGVNRWFRSLPQYDQWTPALDNNFAYAYVGSALHVLDRFTGEIVFRIPDPGFDWNGYSMDLAPVLGNLDDVIVIQNGRIVSFSISSRNVRWEKDRDFDGQPSLANGVIYAIDGRGLVALDEATGQDLWTWLPPQGGTLRNSMVVTDTHIFCSTAQRVYALELISHTDVWSYPAEGNLALGNETLYIASGNGLLTAISMPEHTPAALTDLEITGPAQVKEFASAEFRVMARYDDGRIRDRTLLAEWSVEPGESAHFDAEGSLIVGELFSPTERVTVRASYTENGVTMNTAMEVELLIDVTLDEFIERNLVGARDMKAQMIDALLDALHREEAARTVLEELAGNHPPDGAPPPSILALRHLVNGINSDRLSQWNLERSMVDLEMALAILESGAETPLREVIDLHVDPVRNPVLPEEP